MNEIQECREIMSKHSEPFTPFWTKLCRYRNQYNQGHY